MKTIANPSPHAFVNVYVAPNKGEESRHWAYLVEFGSTSLSTNDTVNSSRDCLIPPDSCLSYRMVGYILPSPLYRMKPSLATHT